MKKVITLILVSILISQSGFSQTGIEVSSMTHCDDAVESFLSTFNIPGATFAMARNGKLVYMRAFGDANLAGTEDVQPHHLFRIASLSKPITSIGIMKLVETGQLSLADKVFGPGSIFANHTYFNSANITDPKIYDITVQHLLEHSGGWNRDIACVPSPTTPYPWYAGHCDPIGFPLHVTQMFGESNPVSKEALIRFLMEKGTDFTPGSAYAYSNIGYLTLGMIIEEKTGLSYEDYMKSEIFSPLGICDMHIAGNLLADKKEREAEYQGNGYVALDIFGTGTTVPWEYGALNVEAMDAHGGWIATAKDLVRLILAVDGFATKPDILSPGSITSMTTGSSVNVGYAFGWSVNQFNNWWHTGAIDGTATIMARASNGFVWAVLLNKRIIDNTANSFWVGLDNLPWNCLSNTSTWPSHDLLESPTESSSDIVFSSVSQNAATVSWTPGNGAKKIVVAKQGAGIDRFPLDGVDYAASSVFASGDDLGNGNYVVMNGTGNSVTITDLQTEMTYYFRVFDYNQNAVTGNYALYRLCDSESASVSTMLTSIDTPQDADGFSVYPNPASGIVNLEYPDKVSEGHLRVLSSSGQALISYLRLPEDKMIDISGLSSGVYIVEIRNENGIWRRKVLKL